MKRVNIDLVIPEKKLLVPKEDVFHKLFVTSDPYINVYHSEWAKHKGDLHGEVKKFLCKQ